MARLCAVLLVAGAVLLETTLLVMAGPPAMRALGFQPMADLCERLFGNLVAGGTAVGAAAAMAAVFVPALIVHRTIRAHRTYRVVRVEPGVGRHERLGAHDLVVLPSDRMVAFSLAGRPCQVVVSRGLVDALAAHEFVAVLRHELAHLRHRHQAHLLLAAGLDCGLGALPFVRRSTAAFRFALERWADEEAAAGAADGRASVHSALLRLSGVIVGPEVAAFTSPGTLVERIEALQAASASGSVLAHRALVYAPTLLLLLLTSAGFVGTLEQTSLLHVLVRLCPT